MVYLSRLLVVLSLIIYPVPALIKACYPKKDNVSNAGILSAGIVGLISFLLFFLSWHSSSEAPFAKIVLAVAGAVTYCAGLLAFPIATIKRQNQLFKESRKS